LHACEILKQLLLHHARLLCCVSVRATRQQGSRGRANKSCANGCASKAPSYLKQRETRTLLRSIWSDSIVL